MKSIVFDGIRGEIKVEEGIVELVALEVSLRDLFHVVHLVAILRISVARCAADHHYEDAGRHDNVHDEAQDEEEHARQSY